MANTVSNVVAGKPLTTGGVLIAPLGTALPTNTSTALNGSFVAAGYISSDGVTETTDRSVEKITAWGGDTVKVVQSEFSLTYGFTFIEVLNTGVLEAIYGDDNVAVTAATVSTGTLHAVAINSDQLPHKSYVFEVRDGDAKIRIVIPDGQITEVGDTVYNDEDVVGYEVTVEAFSDATGNQAYKYLDDGVFDA